MSDGCTEMLNDDRLRAEARSSIAMFRTGGVVIFVHPGATVEDHFTALKILTSGAEECFHRKSE